MAISPLAIVTQGLLNSPLSVVAIRGHLTIETDTGSTVGIRQDRRRQIEEENEIIFAVIVAFLEMVD